MRLDKLVMALVIFSVILIAGVSMIADINNNYNLNMSTSEYNETFNVINQTYNLGKNLTDKTEGSEIESENAFDLAVKGAVSAVRLVSGVKDLFKAIIDQIADELGIPGFFIQFAMIAITIFIAFALVYLYLRFKP